MFHVGQKIECIQPDAGRGTAWLADADRLVLGGVYTVIGLVSINKGGEDVPCVQLAEAKNSWLFDGAYAADRFRPLVERKTEAGMSILREIADKATVKTRKKVSA